MRNKKMLKNISDFIKMISSFSKKLVVVGVFRALSNAVLPFITIYYSAVILDLVYSGTYQGSIKYIALMLTLSLIVGIISRASTQYISANLQIIHDTIVCKTDYKAYTIDYDDFEKEETLNSIRRAKNGSNSSGGCDDFFNSIFTCLEYMFTMVLSTIFVINLVKEALIGTTMSNTSIILLILLLGFYLFSFYISFICSKKSGKETENMLLNNEKSNSQSGYLTSNIMSYENAKDIRLFFMKPFLSKQYEERLVKSCKIYTDWGRKTGLFSGIEIFHFVLASGITYIFIGQKAMLGLISIGSVLMYAGAIETLTTSISNFIGSYSSLAFKGEYISLFEKFIKKPSIHETGNLKIEKQNANDYTFTFENVSFKYPGSDNYVLKNVSCTFDVNKKTAIVGENGAGKTTLIKLLCRLYVPTEGRILLNGIDISKYNYSEYTELFSVVFQDFKLFSYPLKENIACSEDIDENKVIDSLKKVDIYKKIEKWPQNINNYIYKENEEGIEISGGEAQKIAIARALYKDGSFVILDEPTSALDPISEAEIYENFNDMIKDKSAIYISHRMSSCKFCDEIMVFRNGELIEKGSHEDLINLNGEYALLFNTQAAYYAV